jgi:hypothetical protein
VARTAPTSLSDQKATPTPAPSPSATAGGAVGDAQQAAGAANAQTGATNQASRATGDAGTGTATGGQSRQQVDFAIVVTASDMGQVTAFLDALRTGPRLLSNITSTVAQNGAGVQVQVTALTYLDGVTATTGVK